MTNPMPIEKLREEFTAEFWGRFVDASVRDRLSSQITDWWINKIIEREKELWQKMEEKKGDGHIMDDVYCVECFKRMPNSHDYKWNEAIENCQSLLDIDEK